MTTRPSSNAQRWANLRLFAATLLIAGGMNAVVGHYAGQLDRTRVEQIRIGDVDRQTTALLDDLDRARLGENGIPPDADRNAVERAMRTLARFEDHATVVGLVSAADLCLAGIDRQSAALHKGDGNRAMSESFSTRPALARLRGELAALDEKCDARSEAAARAAQVSSLASLLVSAALIASFAARHRARTASIADLEVQSRTSESRERRFRLLLDVEEASQDLACPERAVSTVVGLLSRFFDGAPCAYEVVGDGASVGAEGLPRLAPADFAPLRMGRTKIEDGLVRCPSLRDGELRAVVTVRGDHAWRYEEIALVEEVVAQIGAYVERAEAEAAVRKGEERLRFVLDALNDGVWQWDVATGEVVWSERMVAMLGLGSEGPAPTFEGLRSRVHPDDAPAFDEALDAASASPYSLRLRLLKADGEYLAVLAQGRTQASPSGDAIRMVGTLTDLTDVLEAERAQRQIERQSRWTAAALEAQMNSSLDGILIVDPTGKRIVQNRRMAEVWGLPADLIDDEDDSRQLALALARTKEPDAFLAGVKKLYDHPDRVQRDVIELVDGTVLDRHTAPAVGSDGTIYGRIWTFRDDTERVRAEGELREAHEELEVRVEARTHELAAATKDAERANAAKSEFLSRMSHELRTPLNAILGFGQILERQELDELQEESVHYILKGGRHLLGLINEVLDISRVETGHAELSIEPVPLSDVLVESFAMVRTMALDRDVRLEENVEETLECHVVADRQRLKQVLINLLSNAVKYNRPGGRVSAHCREENGCLRLSIEDTGLGISPEGLSKLFVPFERLEAAATGVEGTGLGLFLTQKLVTTMGGKLEVESTVGEGTTFSLDLELVRAPAEGLMLLDGGASSSSEGDSDRTYTILGIEDNPANIRLFRAILAHRPEIELATADRGMAGFEMARRIEPDLILLDQNLPDVSGGEVLARLKRSGATRDIPVIVISADAGVDKVEASLEAGAYAFLNKPLDIELFLRAMDAALSGRPAPSSKACAAA